MKSPIRVVLHSFVPILLSLVPLADAAAMELTQLTSCCSEYDFGFVQPSLGSAGAVAFTYSNAYPPYYEYWQGIEFMNVGWSVDTARFNFGRDPAWSPDGRRLAVAIEYGYRAEAGIWIAEDSAPARQLTFDEGHTEPTWSHDGRWIAFVRGGELWIVSTAGGPAVHAPIGRSVASPSWAPDGRIVFESDGDLWTCVPNAGFVQLTDSPHTDVSPAWSPDGRWIAFSRDGDIWVIAPSGGTPVRLTDDPAFDGQPDWSPQSDAIAFTSDRSGFLNVWLMSGLPDFTTGVTATSWAEVKQLFR